MVCPQWPVSYAQCDTAGVNYFQTDTQREQCERVAVDWLWAWTGRVYGTCPVTVRPCRLRCEPGERAAGFHPTLVGPVGCGLCGGDLCSCRGTGLRVLRLPGPVHRVTSVTVDGVLVPPAAYTVDLARGDLVRVDGGLWPACQDVHAPPTGPGTWVVAYERGLEVPEGGKVAAGVLAVELARAVCGDTACQLPRRVQTVARQGVTLAVVDTMQDVTKGRTGIWLVDSWVASVTQPSGPRVLSPDIPRPRHRVTPTP